jgi:hypothetical protein
MTHVTCIKMEAKDERNSFEQVEIGTMVRDETNKTWHYLCTSLADAELAEERVQNVLDCHMTWRHMVLHKEEEFEDKQAHQKWQRFPSQPAATLPQQALHVRRGKKNRARQGMRSLVREWSSTHHGSEPGPCTNARGKAER